jgi:hypothetical protein
VVLTLQQWRSGNASHLYTTLGIKCEGKSDLFTSKVLQNAKTQEDP